MPPMLHPLLMAPAVPFASRSKRARDRIPEADARLRRCRLCAHQCGSDRSEKPAGICHAGPVARIFSAQTEVSDELELIPTFAVALSGCDLRCSFCITGAESWNARAGEALDLAKLSAAARSALDQGARTIMILGGEPTIHLPSVLRIVSVLPDDGRLIWKTNAHGARDARELLAGLFDVWLADYKFGNEACAFKLAKVNNYTDVVRENLIWADQDAELIVRHLLMPGHLECCWLPIARWLGREMPGVKVNLRHGFWPAWQSRRHPEFAAPVSPAEVAAAHELARENALHLIE